MTKFIDSLFVSVGVKTLQFSVFLFFLIETLNRENVVLVLGRRQTQHKNQNGESDGSLFLTRPWKRRSCCAGFFFLHLFKVFVCLGCQMKSLCLRCGTACSRWRSKTWESTARRESRSQPKWESSSTNEHTDFVCFHFFYILLLSSYMDLFLCYCHCFIFTFMKISIKKGLWEDARENPQTHRRIGGQYGG